jgi:hypothetical protein
MKPKTLPVLEMCIENGVTRGYFRAHKHTDTPDEAQMLDAMYQAIMEEICEWFEFDEKN